MKATDLKVLGGLLGIALFVLFAIVAAITGVLSTPQRQPQAVEAMVEFDPTNGAADSAMDAELARMVGSLAIAQDLPTTAPYSAPPDLDALRAQVAALTARVARLEATPSPSPAPEPSGIPCPEMGAYGYKSYFTNQTTED